MHQLIIIELRLAREPSIIDHTPHVFGGWNRRPGYNPAMEPITQRKCRVILDILLVNNANAGL